MAQDARRDEEQLTERRARLLGMPYIDTSQIADKELYKDLLSTAEMYQMKLVPIKSTEGSINFGITTNTSQQAIQGMKQRFLDQRLSFSIISDTGYHDYMKLYDPPKQVVYQNIELTNAGTEDLIQNVSQTLEQVRANDMLAYLVQQAHKLQASDIHVEAQREYVRIRFRIDGVLHPIARLTHEKAHILISAIASAANVSTAADDAQQGHISQRLTMADGSEVDVNLRVETVPVVNGMDVVMRLFNMDQSMYNLDKLALAPEERKVVDEIISKPTGLVMAVGPTGSGKTTTLYSILNSLNSEERKIITIEDPVEYQFEGVAQIPVTSKTGQETNFADKLRAVLRLDPDVVMVGEIRDLDTAKTALQAALTGHLVLATFHASSAAAALTRIMDVVGENPLFASSIRLVMAQRLVRRLDDTTKQPYEPDAETIKKIEAILDSLPSTVKKPDISNLKLYKPGKSADNPYGFREQIPLREQLTMSPELAKLLQSGSKTVSTQEIEAVAIKAGMKSMLQDGILKVIAGQTTLEEVYRVIG